jgi:spermidine/putrescine transport system substrate-binding protein
MNNRHLPHLPSDRSLQVNIDSVGHNRRDFLRRAAMLGLLGPAALAACGGSSKPAASAADGSTPAPDSTSGDTGGGDSKKIRVASWPFYIENDQDPKSAATIKSLIDKGYSVDYQTAIDDNISFTEKFAGDLKAGKDFGFDLAIPTSWMTARWIQEGWAQKIPAASVPNKSNVVDYLANPEWDKGREYTLPYAIGQVGIAYYPEKTGFEIATLKDFLKPELKGKVSILSELRDTVGTFMIMMDIDPATASTADALKAIAEIKKYRDQGHFKKITGNSYTEDLTLGDTWAALGWSGDVRSVQAEKPALKWVLPGTSAMSFVDTMIIPKGGNAESAGAWMNHIYDPAVAGPLYEAIGYVSPVKGAAESMTAGAKADVFINPPASVKLIEFKPLTTDEANQLDEAFAAATQQ